MHVVYTSTWKDDARDLNCSQQNPSPAHWFSKDHVVKQCQLHGRVGGLIYRHTPLQFSSKEENENRKFKLLFSIFICFT